MATVIEDTKGKIRDKPITSKLKELLSDAADIAGVEKVVVTSGGQAAKGSGGKRTGSTRHDHGNAADLHLVDDGKVLNFTKKKDLPIFVAFATAAASLGATGLGAGTSYMGPNTIHVGYGTKAVWAKKGEPPLDWLVDAAEAGWDNPQKASAGTSSIPAASAVGRFIVMARNGLRLRAGPGTDFSIRRSLPFGTVLTVIDFDGADSNWAKIDLEGDGLYDGHVHQAFLSAEGSMIEMAAVDDLESVFEPDAESETEIA